MTATRPVRSLVIVLAVLAALAVVWWRVLDRRRPANVLVITLDTTRADRLSPYGFMDAAMPSLDRLAREGVVFDQATSVAPLTLPAHTSLFTGLFPPGHGVRDNADRALATSHTTLAEVLRGRGFCTGAFVSSAVLDPDRGLARGFETYMGVPSDDGRTLRRYQRPADEVVAEAIRWVDDLGDCPFFLWAHFYDPHRPYEPPEPYRSRHFDPYIGEIAFVDSQIGRLLDAVQRRDLLEGTIVVVVGDHGESLGEHGEESHGIFVYESVLRVPLIIRLPRSGSESAPAVRRVGEVVRLVDVMPTLLDLLGLPGPPVDGVSLVDLIEGKRGGFGLEAYSESMYPARLGWSPLRTLRDGRFKLIEAPRPELYDLERDPFETQNIYEERSPVASAMTWRLNSVASPGAGGTAAPQGPGVPPDLKDRLRALGYVASPARASWPRGDWPDPKDCMDSYRKPLAGSRSRAHGNSVEFTKCEGLRQD